MGRIARALLGQPRLRAYLKRVYLDAAGAPPAAPDMPETSIPETTPLNCRPSEFEAPRLNLLVPALALQDVFGGIATALELFRELGGDDQNLRIVLTERLSFDAADNPAYQGWRVASLDDADGPGRRIVPAADRYGRTLPVGPGDRFVATAWWTAVCAREIQQWQAQQFSFEPAPRFLYLIQDYEPGFYPWSARYALADATYRDTERVVALFNTRLLRRFFEDEGYRFASAFEFEPRLGEKLRALREQAMTLARERRVLVYGRPGVPRNAFPIIVEGLRRFVATNPDSDWTFVSAGEAHPPIELGGGRMLTSVGKLTIEQYAQELGRCGIGVSLMVSPHPSYPPLEMAAFGMQVITNRYKSKDLSALAPNIHSLDAVSPPALAAKLAALAAASPADASVQVSSPSPFFHDYLHGAPEFGRLAATLRALLL